MALNQRSHPRTRSSVRQSERISRQNASSATATMAECRVKASPQTAVGRSLRFTTLPSKRTHTKEATPARLSSSQASQRCTSTAADATSTKSTTLDASKKPLEALLGAVTTRSPTAGSGLRQEGSKDAQPTGDDKDLRPFSKKELCRGEATHNYQIDSYDKLSGSAGSNSSDTISRAYRSKLRKSNSSTAPISDDSSGRSDASSDSSLTMSSTALNGESSCSPQDSSLKTADRVAAFFEDATQSRQRLQQMLQEDQNVADWSTPVEPHQQHHLWRQQDEPRLEGHEQKQQQQQERESYRKHWKYEHPKLQQHGQRSHFYAAAATEEPRDCSTPDSLQQNVRDKTTQAHRYGSGTTNESSTGRSGVCPPFDCLRQRQLEACTSAPYLEGTDMAKRRECSDPTARAQQQAKLLLGLLQGIQTDYSVGVSSLHAPGQFTVRSKFVQDAFQSHSNPVSIIPIEGSAGETQNHKSKWDLSYCASVSGVSGQKEVHGQKSGPGNQADEDEKLSGEEHRCRGNADTGARKESSTTPGHDVADGQLLGFKHTLDHLLHKLLQSQWTSPENRVVSADFCDGGPSHLAAPTDAGTTQPFNHLNGAENLQHESVTSYTCNRLSAVEKALHNSGTAELFNSFGTSRHADPSGDNAKNLASGAPAVEENDAGGKVNSVGQKAEQNREQRQWGVRRQSDARCSSTCKERNLDTKLVNSTLRIVSGPKPLCTSQMSIRELNSAVTQTGKAGTAQAPTVPLMVGKVESCARLCCATEEMQKMGSTPPAKEDAASPCYPAGEVGEAEPLDALMEDGELNCSLPSAQGRNDVGEAKRLLLVRQARMFPAVRGVYFDTRSGNLSWRCSWKVDGKKRSRSWSVLKFGMEGARAQAIAERLRRHSKACHTDHVARDFLRCFSAKTGDLTRCPQHPASTPESRSSYGSVDGRESQLPGTNCRLSHLGTQMSEEAELLRSPASWTAQLNTRGASGQARTGSTSSPAVADRQLFGNMSQQGCPQQMSPAVMMVEPNLNAELEGARRALDLSSAALPIRGHNGLSGSLKPVPVQVEGPSSSSSEQVYESSTSLQQPIIPQASYACEYRPLNVYERTRAYDPLGCSSEAPPPITTLCQQGQQTSLTTSVKDQLGSVIRPTAPMLPGKTRWSASRGGSVSDVVSLANNTDTRDTLVGIQPTLPAPSKHTPVETPFTGGETWPLEALAKRRKVVPYVASLAAPSSIVNTTSHPTSTPAAARTPSSAPAALSPNEKQELSRNTSSVLDEHKKYPGELVANGEQLLGLHFRKQRGGGFFAHHDSQTPPALSVGRGNRHATVPCMGAPIRRDACGRCGDGKEVEAQAGKEDREKRQGGNLIAGVDTHVQAHEVRELLRSNLLEEDVDERERQTQGRLVHEEGRGTFRRPHEGMCEDGCVPKAGAAPIPALRMRTSVPTAVKNRRPEGLPNALAGLETTTAVAGDSPVVALQKTDKEEREPSPQRSINPGGCGSATACVAGLGTVPHKEGRNSSHLSAERSPPQAYRSAARGCLAEEEGCQAEEETSAGEATKGDAQANTGGHSHLGCSEAAAPPGSRSPRKSCCRDASLQQPLEAREKVCAVDPHDQNHGTRYEADVASQQHGGPGSSVSSKATGSSEEEEKFSGREELRLNSSPGTVETHVSGKSPPQKIPHHPVDIVEGAETSADGSARARLKEVADRIQNALFCKVVPARTRLVPEKQHSDVCSEHLQSTVQLHTNDPQLQATSFRSINRIVDPGGHQPPTATESWPSTKLSKVTPRGAAPATKEQPLGGGGDLQRRGSVRYEKNQKAVGLCHARTHAPGDALQTPTAAAGCKPEAGALESAAAMLGALGLQIPSTAQATEGGAKVFGAPLGNAVPATATVAQLSLGVTRRSGGLTKAHLPFASNELKDDRMPAESADNVGPHRIARGGSGLPSGGSDGWSLVSEEKTGGKLGVSEKFGVKRLIKGANPLPEARSWGNTFAAATAVAAVSMEPQVDIPRTRYEDTPTTAPSPTPDDLPTEAGPILAGETAILVKEKTLALQADVPRVETDEGTCADTSAEALWQIMEGNTQKNTVMPAINSKDLRRYQPSRDLRSAQSGGEKPHNAEACERDGHRSEDKEAHEKDDGNGKISAASTIGSHPHKDGDFKSTIRNNVGTCSIDNGSNSKVGSDESGGENAVCRTVLLETLLKLRESLEELLRLPPRAGAPVLLHILRMNVSGGSQRHQRIRGWGRGDRSRRTPRENKYPPRRRAKGLR